MDKSMVSIAILLLAVGVVGYAVMTARPAAPTYTPQSSTSNGGWFNSLLGLTTAVVNKVNFSGDKTNNEGSSPGRTYSGAGDGLLSPNF